MIVRFLSNIKLDVCLFRQGIKFPGLKELPYYNGSSNLVRRARNVKSMGSTPVTDPRGGGPNPPGGRQHTILPNFPKNCMQLKEFEPEGRTSKILLYRPTSALDNHLFYYLILQGGWGGGWHTPLAIPHESAIELEGRVMRTRIHILQVKFWTKHLE